MRRRTIDKVLCAACVAVPAHVWLAPNRWGLFAIGAAAWMLASVYIDSRSAKQ
jgi:hypothetical protein